MSSSILVTKLFIPPLRPELVSRLRLIERLNAGLHRKLSLVSAPAGFGKTTLVGEWVCGLQSDDSQADQSGARIAWLALDADDSDPARFLAYFTSALMRSGALETARGERLVGMLASPGPPPAESILTALINQLATLETRVICVLDDYHLVESPPVDQALVFLIDHLPPQTHLVIATREDPQLPLPRLRARGQLSELRAADLRFSVEEATEFLNQRMGLELAAEDIAALENRTEGWIAGLQLAALSMPGGKGRAGFIDSFSGSHQFVLDYLMAEVLQVQPEEVQTFLVQTAVLDRLCGPLCDALTRRGDGQETLEYLAGANLFTIPLDNERRWYRYHHLFADLLRKRLLQSEGSWLEPAAEYHRRASAWYQAHGLELEAFQHAVAAGEVEWAARLAEGEAMPLHFRGLMAPVLNWLRSLPEQELNARPSLWVIYASALTMSGKPVHEVEAVLQPAEAALEKEPPDDQTRDLIGHIAAIRAMLAIPQNDMEALIEQSQRALADLHPANLPVRTIANWTLGYAYQVQGNRAAACQAFTETLAISQRTGNTMISLAASTGLGQIQETENQLHLAAESYRQTLELAGDPPMPAACEAYLGLARIFYQWNDLEAALQHAQISADLSPQMENVDSPISSALLLAQIKLALGDVPGAVEYLSQAECWVQQRGFENRVPEVAAVQAAIFLAEGELDLAAELVEQHELPLSRARVDLAQGDPHSALAVLAPYRQGVEARDAPDEKLRVLVWQAVALQGGGEAGLAVEVLGEALALAEPGGIVRVFLEAGAPIRELLSTASEQGVFPDYTDRLLAEFEAESQGAAQGWTEAASLTAQPWIEPLSGRELEVLGLIAEGLSNRAIGERLYLALSTVKGHNRRIFHKLQVERRTEAVARARELGLL